MSVPNEVGQAIVLLRGTRTQAEVARQAGLSPAVWNQYEKGRRTPTRTNKAKILDGLGCTRLQFEETRWRLLRRRLLTEETAQALNSESGDQESSAAEHGHSSDQESAEARVRIELRRILSQLTPLLEELIVLTVTTRS